MAAALKSGGRTSWQRVCSSAFTAAVSTGLCSTWVSTPTGLLPAAASGAGHPAAGEAGEGRQRPRPAALHGRHLPGAVWHRAPPGQSSLYRVTAEEPHTLVTSVAPHGTFAVVQRVEETSVPVTGALCGVGTQLFLLVCSPSFMLQPLRTMLVGAPVSSHLQQAKPCRPLQPGALTAWPPPPPPVPTPEA